MEDKSYLVPDEVFAIVTEFTALLDLRDKYLKIPFGYKHARKLSLEAFSKRAEFWRKVNELYPELENKKLRLEEGHRKVIVAV